MVLVRQHTRRKGHRHEASQPGTPRHRTASIPRTTTCHTRQAEAQVHRTIAPVASLPRVAVAGGHATLASQTAPASQLTPPAAAPTGESAASIASHKPYRLAHLASRVGRTIVQVGEARFGAGRPVIIGGPCSVETEEQIIATAQAVRDAGGQVLRGGAFKPRTSPYAFSGLGEEGLRLLAWPARPPACRW